MRGLLDDLEMIHRSLSDNRGGLVASGMVARVMRTVATCGFHLATLDIRQHADHGAAGSLYGVPAHRSGDDRLIGDRPTKDRLIEGDS